MADALAITKADGTDIERAQKAKAEYEHALSLMSSYASEWKPRVLTTSVTTKGSIDCLWKLVEEYTDTVSSSGYFSENRKRQNVLWFRDHFNMLLQYDYERFPDLKNDISNIASLVEEQKLSPPAAAQRILLLYHKAIRSSR